MSTRDFIRSILTSFLIISLTLLFSCAGGDTKDGDPLADLAGGEAGSELEGLGAIPDQDIPLEEAFGEGADLGDLGDFGGAPVEEGDLFPGEELGLPEGDGADMALGGEFGLPSEDEMALGAEGGALPNSLPADQDLGSTFGGTEVSDDPNNLDLDNVLGLPSDADLAKAAEMEAAQVALSPDGDMATEGGFGDLGFEQDMNFGGGGVAAGPSKPWSGSSAIPTIPAEAFDQEGNLLNRFYFVRQGDTPENLAQLLLGDAGRSGSLSAWNRGRFRPGKLIYYASPIEPGDRQMRSFYQERSVPPMQITVQRGETLSVIAKRELGSFQSYKEIAVVNGMATADGLTPGQPLAVYPRDLSAYGVNGGYGAPSEPVTPPPAMDEPIAAASPPPPVQAEAPVEFSPPPPVQQQVKERRLPRRNQKRGFSIGRLIQQNGFFILVGTGLIVLISALILVKRRNKQQEEYSDDDLFGDQMK